MRWPDGIDIGVSLSGDQCIKYDTATNYIIESCVSNGTTLRG